MRNFITVDANRMIDDVLWDMAGEEDLLGLDHVDRTRSLRNGVGDLFLK